MNRQIRRQSKKTRRRRLPVRQRGLTLRRNPFFPPELMQKPIQQRTLRYIATQVLTETAYGPAQLINAILSVTAASVSAYPVFESVRLKRISMYYTPSSSFDPSTDPFSFRWVDQNLPDILITRPGTLNQPSCIKVVPPENSLCAMWYNLANPSVTGVIPFCLFTCNSTTIIDIEFDFIIGEGAQTAVTLTGVPGFAGIAYLNPMINSATLLGMTSTVHSAAI